jgi:hypothetical protein
VYDLEVDNGYYDCQGKKDLRTRKRTDFPELNSDKVDFPVYIKVEHEDNTA